MSVSALPYWFHYDHVNSLNVMCT